MYLIRDYKHKIKSQKFKISFSFESLDPCFYLKPLLFLSNAAGHIRDVQDAIGEEYRISNCQGVIFNRRHDTFLLDLSRLDREIESITLVLSPPADYHFHTLTNYRVAIEGQDIESEKFWAISSCSVAEKSSDFVMVFNLVRHTRHSGWYLQGRSRYFSGDAYSLYRLFGYQDYFPETICNLHRV